MAQLSIAKRLEWDAGHRLLKHGGKCQHLHGHRYAAVIEVGPSKFRGVHRDYKGVDDVGVVVDFSVVKREVGGWIDERWDHGYIAQKEDPFGKLAEELGMKVYWMDRAPSAENLAEELYCVAKVLLEPHHVVVRSVSIWETPTSVALFGVPGVET